MAKITIKQFKQLVDMVSDGVVEEEIIKKEVKLSVSENYIRQLVETILGLNKEKALSNINQKNKEIERKQKIIDDAQNVIYKKKQEKELFIQKVETSKDNISVNFGLWHNKNGFLDSKWFKKDDVVAFLEHNFMYGFRIVAKRNYSHKSGDNKPYISFWLTNSSINNLYYDKENYEIVKKIPYSYETEEEYEQNNKEEYWYDKN